MKLSRTKVELFIDCPRCFYLNVVKGIRKPSFPAFTLNIAVDSLLKKEFDLYRAKGEPHPYMKAYDVNAIPFKHEKMDEWRNNFKGIQYHDKKTDILFFGAVDDIWVTPKNELIVVDYKATSKKDTVDKLEDTRWHNAYKRQMEFYQWLFRKNGFKVSNTGYFVYCNGKKSEKSFKDKLLFDVHLIAYKGDDSWVEKTIKDLAKCLKLRKAPEASPECEYCAYRAAS